MIKNGTLMMAGAALLPRSTFAARAGEKIVGLQLYSVRDDMHKDPAATLKQLATMGYKYVEHAGYGNGKFYGYAPKDFRKLLDGLGLKMPSGHTSLNLEHWDDAKKHFTDTWKQTLADAATAGQQYVISPSMEESVRENYDELMRVLDLFNKCGELCKKSGLGFGYHNHDFEFKYSLKGSRIYDLILQHTDPALVAQQLDIGNMYGAGGRALDIINKHPGRFISMHVKDEIKTAAGEMSDGYESTVLGKGVVGTRDIVNAGYKTGGTKYFIVEQESYQGKTPLDTAREDLAVMKQWGF